MFIEAGQYNDNLYGTSVTSVNFVATMVVFYLPVSLNFCLSVCQFLFVSLFISLSFCPFIRFYIHPPSCPPTSISICTYFYLSLPLCLSCLTVFSSIYLSLICFGVCVHKHVCLSIWLLKYKYILLCLFTSVLFALLMSMHSINKYACVCVLHTHTNTHGHTPTHTHTHTHIHKRVYIYIYIYSYIYIFIYI